MVGFGHEDSNANIFVGEGGYRGLLAQRNLGKGDTVVQVLFQVPEGTFAIAVSGLLAEVHLCTTTTCSHFCWPSLGPSNQLLHTRSNECASRCQHA